MAWRIELTAGAIEQLGKQDKSEAKRITTFMRQGLAGLDNPRSAGKALTGPQPGMHWRYRVGNDGIICDIQDEAFASG